MIYVALFWIDRAQDVDSRIISNDRSVIVEATLDRLRSLNVPEDGYEAFLVDRIRDWDGEQTHITSVAEGKLIMFSGRLQDASAAARFV